jgi:oligopeptide/dipeptide ABC transporter ATP-binding protein
MKQPLLEAKDVHTWFFTNEGTVRAVDGASFSVDTGATVCVVGESGCGKSIMARSVLNLIDKPGRIVKGSITYRYADGATVDTVALDPRGPRIRQIRGREIAMIFQEPMSSLGPVNRIGDQLVETIRLHLGADKDEAARRSLELLEKVGIPNPRRRMRSYSFELSGGMRQRVMIALALACDSRLIIADEPTTALDVTTQAGILELLKSLQRQGDRSLLFITHDLGVVAEIADEIAVMYLGKVVERADVFRLFANPLHPYTRALLESIPRYNQARHARLASIKGMVPHPFARPPGCPFGDRCDRFMAGVCDAAMPPEVEPEPGHTVACALYAAEGRP